MVVVPKDNVQVSFDTTADTMIQNVSAGVVKFHTDDTETVWGSILPAKIVQVPSGTTVFFKSEYGANLATIEL